MKDSQVPRTTYIAALDTDHYRSMPHVVMYAVKATPKQCSMVTQQAKMDAWSCPGFQASREGHNSKA